MSTSQAESQTALKSTSKQPPAITRWTIESSNSSHGPHLFGTNSRNAVRVIKYVTNQLPRLEMRMSVFLAASDETEGAAIFHHAGYVAPVSCWTDVFCPAWQREVLAGPPQLDEFHMTELRSPSWREQHGITEDDAQARIDAAVDLISRTMGLFAVRSSIVAEHFEDYASGLRFRLNDPRRGPAQFLIDYPSFQGYAYLVLMVCSLNPKTEKVDFVIEKKREVFPAMHDFHEGLSHAFEYIGLPRVAKAVGELIPGDKKRIPLQAADLLCWHTQRLVSSARNPSISFSDVDRQRFAKLTRIGTGHTWERQMIEELCGTLFEDWRKLNEIERVSEIQSADKYESSGPTQER